MTFFGGRNGFDFICFDNKGLIQCSGRRRKMLEFAKNNNWAVAKLYPVRYGKVMEG